MRILIALIASAATVAAPTVVAKIPVSTAAQPCAAQAGGKYVWVSEFGQPYLLKINPATNKVVGRAKVGFGACGLGYGAGSMWVEDTSSSTVSRVSVATGKRTPIKVGATPYDAMFAYGSAWTTAYGAGELERINPATNRINGRWKLSAPTGAVGAFGSVWASGIDSMIRVDATSGKLLATIALADGGGWTAASDDAVWSTSGKGLTRIDRQTNTVATEIALPGAPYLGDPDVIGGKVWVPEIRLNKIAVIDPATNTIVQTIPAGKGPFVITQINGQAWVPSWKGHDIWRIKP